MINLKTFSENGGFYVEFNGVFLGAGQAELELQGQTHEMRRDNLHLLRQRILRNMTLKVKVRLAAGDRFWELLCANAGQAEKLCCAGGSLRLGIGIWCFCDQNCLGISFGDQGADGANSVGTRGQFYRVY